jgi:hypothetical protein
VALATNKQAAWGRWDADGVRRLLRAVWVLHVDPSGTSVAAAAAAAAAALLVHLDDSAWGAAIGNLAADVTGVSSSVYVQLRLMERLPVWLPRARQLRTATALRALGALVMSLDGGKMLQSIRKAGAEEYEDAAAEAAEAARWAVRLVTRTRQLNPTVVSLKEAREMDFWRVGAAVMLAHLVVVAAAVVGHGQSDIARAEWASFLRRLAACSALKAGLQHSRAELKQQAASLALQLERQEAPQGAAAAAQAPADADDDDDDDR